MDVDDPESVARVVPELADRLGGLDRVIVNAGIGKGASIGTGKAWANRAVLPPTCSARTPSARRRWSCSAPRAPATSC